MQSEYFCNPNTYLKLNILQYDKKTSGKMIWGEKINFSHKTNQVKITRKCWSFNLCNHGLIT